MKKFLICVMTLSMFSIPTTGSAANGRPGPYFTGFLGTSIARNTAVSGFDYGNDVSFRDQVSFDPGVYIGGTGGYDFGFLRLEGELSYRHAKLDTVTDQNGVPFRRVEGDLGTFATMFNVFIDMHNASRVTPYLGGGIGFATVRISDTTSRDIPGNLYDESDDTVAAYQVGAGVDVALNNRFSLDLGYRYFITEKAKLDGNSISSDVRFESHNALVGFKFKF
jgi:opacity protein-like surface antigen